MLSWSTFLQILLSWLSISFLLSLLRRRRLPPGPLPLPIVGNLFSLGTKPHVSLAALAKEHGPVISMQLGSMTTVVVSSAEAAKLVLQKHDSVFSTRSVLDSHTVMGHSDASIVLLPPNERWKGLRKICATQIFSNSRLEASCELRRQKVQQLLDYVKVCCKGEKAVNIGEATFTTSLNFLANTFFSSDMADLRSEKASELKQLIWALMVESGSANVSDFFPSLKFADLQGFRARMASHMERMYKIFDGLTEARLAARGGGEAVSVAEEKDVLDALINMAHQDDSGFQLSDIRHLLMDLFAAGTDTTSSSIEWAMAELLHKPSKLRKAQAELRTVISRDTAVEESDSARLPYLQAIVKETLRLHPPVPFLVPRKLPVDADLSGYTVPRGAQVFVNVWAMGRDERVWENARSFEPERFLGSGLDYKGRDFEYVPFGAGRRICPGLPLGQRMLHLVLGSLLHGFDWKLQEGLTPARLDMEEKFGFTLQKAKPLLAVPVTSSSGPLDVTGTTGSG